MKRVGNKSGQLVRSASRRGKSSARFQFDVTVDKIYGVKPGSTYFVKWSRGVKVASTKHYTASKEHAGKAGLPCNQKISLLVTLYREEGKKFDAKDAKLSLILVNPKKQERTAAKIHFDLSVFAGVPSSSTPKVFKLSDKFSIRTVIDSRFLKSGTGGPGSGGASSALSGISGRSSDEDETEDDFDDLALDDVPEPEVTTAPKARKAPSAARSPNISSGKVPALSEAPRTTTSSVTTDRRKASSATPPSPPTQPPARPKRGKYPPVVVEPKDTSRAADETPALDKLKVENEKLSLDLKRAQETRRKMEEAHTEEVSNLKNQIDSQTKEASASASQIVANDASLTLLNSRNSFLESDITSLRKELEQVKQDRDRLQVKAKQLASSEAKNRELSSEVDRLTIAVSETRTASRGVHDNAEIQNRMATLREEKNELDAKLKAHAEHSEKVKQTYEQLSRMYNKLREENLSLQEEVRRGKGALRKATVENSSIGMEELATELEETRNDLRDMEAAKTSLESDHDRLEAQVNVLQERLDKTTQALRDAHIEAEDLHAEAEELKSQRDIAMKRALSKGKGSVNGDPVTSRSPSKEEEDLRIAKEKLERERGHLMRRLEEMDTEISDLRMDIEYEKGEKLKAREERDKMRESARALERRTSQAAQQSDTVHSLRRKLSTHVMREQDHESMISGLREEVARLQNELDEAKKGYERQSSGQSDEVESILQILVPTKLALAEAEEEKLHLQFSMKQLKKNEKAIQQRLAAHASRLEVKLGLATEELELLRRRHDANGNGGLNELGMDVDY